MSETQVKKVWLHRRAEMALGAYSPEERKKVEQAIQRLAESSEGASIRRHSVQKLNGSNPDYIFRATPQVRVLFDETPDEIQVLDIILAKKLDYLHSIYLEHLRSAETHSQPKHRRKPKSETTGSEGR